MIQRIQTLYRLIATALLVAVNFFPLATFSVIQAGSQGMYRMSVFGIDSFGVEAYAGAQWACWLFPVFSGLAALISLFALFDYKNRLGQMQKCIYGILLVILFYMAYGLQVWFVYSTTSAIFMPSITAQLPLVAVIFLFLAGRAVKRDEDLVRSMDRLR